MKTVTISAEDKEWLIKMSHTLRTQDHFGTRDPMYCVQVQRFLVADDEYSNKYHWVAIDDPEDWSPVEVGDPDEREGYEKIAVHEFWETVQVFLTHEGAKEHMETNRHRLIQRGYNEGPQIMVESFYRNKEMLRLRDIILKLTGGES